MSWAKISFAFVGAFLAIFWQCAFPGVRDLLRAQPDLLPGLMVYAGFSFGFGVVTLLAIFAGLLFDSLSANPLGVTILPLLLAGGAVCLIREYLLETQVTAQAVLGAAASAFAPVFTLVVMLTLGHAPLLGWGTLWQLLVMTAAGACITPLWFILAEWVQAHLFYERAPHSAFRPDREIHRGRS